MRTHTSEFKEKIKLFGREIKGKIIYYPSYDLVSENADNILTENNLQLISEQANYDDPIEINEENIFSISIIKNGDLLQSLMKEFDFEVKNELNIGSVVNPHFGLLIDEENQEYEYLDYRNYIIYSKEFNMDTETWSYVCYDKMLFAMVKYIPLSNVNFPITIKEYINLLCNKIGVEFEDSDFVNQDQLIYQDLYKDKGLTYRDVFDEISKIVAGNLLINDNDKLEVSYAHKVGEISNVSNSSIEIESEEEAELSSFELEGKTTQETNGAMPSPDYPSPLVSVGYENLFYIAQTSASTSRGVTFTPNEDKSSLIANGTATGGFAFKYLVIDADYEWLEAGTYYLNSCGTCSNDVYLQFGAKNSNNTTIVDITEKGKPTKFVLNERAYINIYARVNSGITVDNKEIKIMITKTNETPSSYIPYGKYGIEVKTTGKNLFDLDTAYHETINASGVVGSNESFRTSDYIKTQPNTNYYFSTTQKEGTSNKQIYIAYYDSSFAFLSRDSYNLLSKLFTTPSNCYYMRAGVYTAEQENIMLEKGNQATTYEAYKDNTYSYTLDNPLRAIGDYKDKLYIENGMLYVDRKIGFKTIVGNDITAINTNQTNTTRAKTNNNFVSALTEGQGYSNYFQLVSNWGNDNVGIYFSKTNGDVWFRANKSTIGTTLANVKTWTDNNNVEVQYILAEPYTEALGQVNIPSTYEGITYIDTTDDLEPTMNISYISEFEKIDEEYLNDTNVKISEKIGVINSVAILDTDNNLQFIAEDTNSIKQNEMTRITITDNLIALNGESQIIADNILNKLNGLYYYANDLTTTGVCYYDYLDLFNVKFKGNTYKCLLLNNEITINQGIEEHIFTEKFEESETSANEYTTSVMSDKQVQFKINQQEGKLESKVEKNGVISAINQSAEEVQINADKISLEGKQINLTTENIELYTNVHDKYEYTNQDITILMNIIQNETTPTEQEIDKYDFNNDGILTNNDLLWLQSKVFGYSPTGGTFRISGNTTTNIITTTSNTSTSNNITTKIGLENIETKSATFQSLNCFQYISLVSNETQKIYMDASNGNISCVSLTQTSKAQSKKNFEKLTNAKEILNATDIYKYNFKDEENGTKKSIGFVIGDDYNYSEEITSENNDGANIYSMVSVLWQVVKEQQEEIEKLKEMIKNGKY